MAMRIFILNLFVCQIYSDLANASLTGYLGPPDAMACATQNVTLNCTLTKTDTYTSSDLELKIMSAGISTIIKNSNMTIVNNRTVTYTMEHLTLEDHHTNIDCFITGSKYQYVGELLLLQVYEFPKEVENFSCVVHDYDKDMNCSWTVLMKYPNVTTLWKITNYSLWTEFSSSEKTFSYIGSTNDGYFSMRDLQIRVTVASECERKVMSIYDVNTRKIVKPNPVDDLRSNTINSTCVLVTWKPNAKQYKKRYHISYTSKWGDPELKTLIDTKETKLENKNITVCDLVPYTQYTFTVKVHPYREGYWSDERQTTATTSESIPMSPEVTKGGYRLKDPQQCKSDKYRDVVVYWKALDDINKNGKITSIQVTYNSTYATDISSVGSDATHTSEMLLCNTAYSVSVQAKNNAGFSEVESTIDIPAVSADGNFALPYVFVEMYQNDSQKEDVYIEWKPPATADVNYTSSTVFWCDKEQGECLYGTLNWMTVLGTNTTLTMKMERAEYKLYGVSMETADGSNGLSWTACIYTKEANPTKAPTNLNVKEGSEDNTLSVTWNKIECQSGQPFIASYNVTFYDITKGKDDMMTVRDIPSDVNTATLTDLNADMKYAVQVQGVTRSGSVGPPSEPKYGIPVDNNSIIQVTEKLPQPGILLCSLKYSEIVGICVGGFFGLMFIVSGIWCTVRCCITRLKDRLKDPYIYDIPIPDGPHHDNDSNTDVENKKRKRMRPALVSQTSKDSGVYDSQIPPTTIDDKGKALDRQQISHKESIIAEGYVQIVQNIDTSNDNPGCVDIQSNGNVSDELVFKREITASKIGLLRSASSEPLVDKGKQSLNGTETESTEKQVMKTDGSVLPYVKATQEQNYNAFEHNNNEWFDIDDAADRSVLNNGYVSTDNMQLPAPKPNTPTLDYVSTTGFSLVLQASNGPHNDPTNLGMLSARSPDCVTTAMLSNPESQNTNAEEIDDMSCPTVVTKNLFHSANGQSDFIPSIKPHNEFNSPKSVDGRNKLSSNASFPPVNSAGYVTTAGLNPLFCEDNVVKGSHMSDRNSCSDDSGHGSLEQGSPGTLHRSFANGSFLSTQLQKPSIFPSEPIPTEVNVSNDGYVSHIANFTPCKTQNVVPNDPGYVLQTDNVTLSKPHNVVQNDPGYVSQTNNMTQSKPQKVVPNDPGYVLQTDNITLSKPHNVVQNDPGYVSQTDNMTPSKPQNVVPNDPGYVSQTDSITLSKPDNVVPNDPGYVLQTDNITLSKPHNVVPNDPGYVSQTDNMTPSKPHNVVQNDPGYVSQTDNMTPSKLHNVVPNDPGYMSQTDIMTPSKPHNVGYISHIAANNVMSPSKPNDPGYLLHSTTGNMTTGTPKNMVPNDPGYLPHSATVSPQIFKGGPTPNADEYKQTTQL